MRTFRILIRLVPILFFGMILHYVLPQHDVVRVTSTEVIRTDFSALNRIFYAQADNGKADQPTRDLRLINTDRQKAWFFGFFPRDSVGVMVYRNEDTGWIWPPYFKFDSADLQAEAASAARTDGWYVMTHYGWRNRWLSIYPNAIALRPVDGPDVRIIPWFNIFFFVFLAGAWVMLRLMWMQFRERTIDPLMDDVETGVARKWSRLTNWLNSWKSKDRR